jgi:hypothetical protein
MSATSTAAMLIAQVATSTETLIGASWPLWISLAGIGLAIFAAFAILYAVVYAAKGAL